VSTPPLSARFGRRYAVVYYQVPPLRVKCVIPLTRNAEEQVASRRLYYARDCLGRRSLLVHYPTVDSPCFLLASVSAGADSLHALDELDTGYIHFVDLRAWAADSAVRYVPVGQSSQLMPGRAQARSAHIALSCLECPCLIRAHTCD
jgi:hypothetical protein